MYGSRRRRHRPRINRATRWAPSRFLRPISCCRPLPLRRLPRGRTLRSTRRRPEIFAPLAPHLPRPLLLLPRELGEFVLQLQIAVESIGTQCPFGEGSLHRAARFVAMAAVREMTVSCERFDVVERLANCFRRVPQLELTHAWCVDDEPAVGQHHELAMRRR